jgi:hypothetical protein
MKTVKMKLCFIITICSLLCSLSFAQVPPWQWIKDADGSDRDWAYSVALDAQGNAYVAGVFQSPTLTLGSFTLSNAGQYDIFLAKYNPAGQVVWAKSVGGPLSEWAVAINVDNAGSLYLTGYYHSAYVLFGMVTLINQGFSDIYLAKYDTNGTALWAKSVGGTGSESASCVTTDASGDVYIAGGFTSPALAFGPITLTHSGMTSDVFLAKYDSNGTEIWARGAGSPDNDGASSVAVDASGHVYLTGSFHGDLIGFDLFALTNVNPGWGSSDLFLVKYDAGGDVIWAKSAGGIYGDEANGIRLDANGNPVIAGNFESPTLDFTTTILTNADTVNGNDDLFLVKYDTSGNITWAKSAGGIAREYLLALDLDAAGNVYIAGGYEDSALTIGSDVLLNEGMYDLFAARYDASGNAMWAKTAGGEGIEFAYGIAVNDSGQIYVAGLSESAAPVFDSVSVTCGGLGDMVLAKTGTIKPAGIEQLQLANDLFLYPNPTSGNLHIFTKGQTILQITDLQGRIVRTGIPGSGETVIDLNGLSAGMYVLKAATKQGSTARRFIKQ